MQPTMSSKVPAITAAESSVQIENIQDAKHMTPMQLVRRHAGEISSFRDEERRTNHLMHNDNDDSSLDEDDEIEEVLQKSFVKTEDMHDAFVAKEAARAADCVGWCVMLSMMAMGGIMAVLVYFFVTGQETQNFEVQYQVVSKEVILGVQRNSDQLYQQLQFLGRSLISRTSDSFLGQPVPLNDWEPFAQGVRKQFRLPLLAYAPWLTTDSQREDWGLYSSTRAQDWVNESYQYQLQQGRQNYSSVPSWVSSVFIRDFIWRFRDNGFAEKDFGPGPYSPAWLWSLPFVKANGQAVLDMENFNFFTNPIYRRMANETVNRNDASSSTGAATTSLPNLAFLSPPFNLSSLYGAAFQMAISDRNATDAYSVGLIPVWSTPDLPVNGDANLTGHLSAAIPWTTLFGNILQDNQKGLTAVVNSCSGAAVNTYTINGKVATYAGSGDLHSPQYSKYAYSSYYYGLVNRSDLTGRLYCKHEIIVYPTGTYQSSYTSYSAVLFTATISAVMFISVLLFLSYDYIMRRQQSKVLGEAERSNAIVASLFPGKVARRLFMDQSHHSSVNDLSEGRSTHSVNLRNFMNKGDFKVADASRPIAELFPEATVMFADIAGFTAWSSIREPSQVFTLLESIFQSFDAIAKSFGVFKVETVGDCYVACCGVPEPNEDHATVMAQFARECMRKFNFVVQDLELKLGPDTSDLAVRIGLNSGPVTAGVLRGERARFQLFGDTVNTAARMESTGQKGRIHISEQTANILIAHGRGSWVKPREDMVEAKGKGTLKTFWLEEESAKPRLWAQDGEAAAVGHLRSSMQKRDVEQSLKPELPAELDLGRCSDTLSESSRKKGKADDFSLPEQAPIPTSVVLSEDRKTQRLVDWNCELLMQLLKQVVARRFALSERRSMPDALWEMARTMGLGHMPVEEVVEVIVLPDFDERAIRQVDPETVILSPEVSAQCRNYVALLASMYRKNPFHNFEHASHVTMSVSKLLSRIVAPEVDKEKLAAGMHQELLLHDHTYGITSDPLTQFSVVLSALIHDVDHRGVPNFLLVQEDPNLAAVYRSKSVAEQNSVDMAWNALMRPEFGELRNCIFADKNELRRFRALVVNSVIATDIFDKELGTLRKNRWAKAFSEHHSENTRQDVNRKATIVIEHLIQASDVAHTMQHWHVYQKWNERLFQEMYQAHLTGRWEKDPSAGWYDGEIGFFDNYIIPLAKKLKDCGVFGVASDEYLNYALQNRQEWGAKGSNIVARMVAKYGLPREKEEAKTEL